MIKQYNNADWEIKKVDKGREKHLQDHPKTELIIFFYLAINLLMLSVCLCEVMVFTAGWINESKSSLFNSCHPNKYFPKSKHPVTFII